MSLAVKYRPQSFTEICGQTITVDILNKQIQNKTFKNAYGFFGASGCGKTTVARCFARMINGGIDSAIELDCATNGNVDNIRAIMDSANQRSLTGEYKIFILDECHAISSAGWQAFLKGIEETPKYTIFIFCSTEPQKIPATILNRVQRYNFAPVDPAVIKDRLMYICRCEGFTNYEPTCELLSKSCFGSMRDAITSLEQIADYSTDLSLDVAKTVTSGLSSENMFKLTWAITKNNSTDIFNIIDSLYTSGQDLKNFIDTYLTFVLDLSKYILFKDISITNIPAYLAADSNPVVQYTVDIDNNLTVFNKLAKEILNVKLQIKYDQNYKTTITIMLLDIANNLFN